MEGLFMDQSSMNPGSSLSAAIAANKHCNMMLHGYNFSPSIASISQLFPSVHVGNGLGLFGSRPLPPLYSSLPPSRQPPLLPLPFSKSATLASPSKRTTAAAATARSRQHKNKPRPSAGSRKEVRSPGNARSDPKHVEKAPVALKLEEGKEGKEEKFLGWSLYSISPPPSSLPLPRFSLTRPKATDYSTTVSCNVEATGRGFGGRGVRGGDAGATDDVRRLLRL